MILQLKNKYISYHKMNKSNKTDKLKGKIWVNKKHNLPYFFL